MKIVFLLASLFICNSFSQYLTVPQGGFPSGKNDVASTIYPCGWNLSTIIFDAATDVTAGQYLNGLSWALQPGSNLNPNGNDPIALDLFTYYYQTTNTSSTVVATFYQNLHNYTWGNSPTNVRVPLGTNPNSYLLRFSYAGYYSCAVINITAPAINIVAQSPGDTVYELPLPGTWRYFELDQFTAGSELTVTVNGPSSPYTKVVIAADLQSGQLANDYALETITTGPFPADTNVLTGVCYDGFTTNPVDYVVGVYSDPTAIANDTTSAFTVNFASYTDSRIQATDPYRSVPAHQGNLYFWTNAYSSDSDGKLRVVLTVDNSGSIPTVFYGATNCAGTANTFNIMPNYIYSAGKTCLDLPDSTTTKYIKVGGPMADSYEIVTERGSCSNLSSSDGNIFTISILLLVVAFLLNLF